MEFGYKDKIRKLEEQVKKYESKKEQLNEAIRDLLDKQKKEVISYTECVYRLNNFLEGKSVYEWVDYYDKCKKTALENISYLKRSEQESKDLQKRLSDSWRKGKIASIKQNIELYKEKGRNLRHFARTLEEKQKKGLISYSKYQYLLNNFREGKSVADWVSYYEECEKQAPIKIAELHPQNILPSVAKEDLLYSSVKSLERILQKEIVEKKPVETLWKSSPLERRTYRVFGFVIMILVGMSLLVTFSPDSSTVAMAVLGVDSVYNQPFNAYVNTNTDFVLSAGYLEDLKSFKISGELIDNGSVEVYFDGMLVLDYDVCGNYSFLDTCEETCNLKDINKENYNLSLKIRRGGIRIDSIKYTTKSGGEEPEGFNIANIEYPDFQIQKPTLSDIKENITLQSQIMVCELNRDEKPDIVLGRSDEGTVYLWYGDLTNDQQPHTILKGGKGFGYAVDIADLNEDGTDDLLVWGVNDTVRTVYAWYGGKVLGKDPNLKLESAVLPRLKRNSDFIDLNGDGIKDLVGVTPLGDAGIWYGTKSGFLDKTTPDVILLKK